MSVNGCMILTYRDINLYAYVLGDMYLHAYIIPNVNAVLHKLLSRVLKRQLEERVLFNQKHALNVEA